MMMISIYVHVDDNDDDFDILVETMMTMTRQAALDQPGSKGLLVNRPFGHRQRSNLFPVSTHGDHMTIMMMMTMTLTTIL